VDYVPTRNSLKVLDQLDTRASLLSFSNSLDEVALDKYSFTRDAFLQRRNNAVFDGNPPEDDAQGKPATR
jgi:phospholipid-binding lipoprotein MlaA